MSSQGPYIIDKISERPAKYVRVPTPENFKTTYHRHKYWEEEVRRWHEGYAGIHGFQYFYIQECHIPNSDGLPIRPHWRECDDDTIVEMFSCFEKRWDAGIVKRREYGLTSVGGALPFYHMNIYPGCHTGMTSCDLDRISVMFNEKVITTWQNFHEDISFPKNKLNQTKNLSFLSVKQAIIDNETGKEKIVYPDIFCPETVKDPSAFSSKRLKFAFIDEFPLHKNRAKLLESLYPTLEKGMVRVGNLLWGGTVEDGIDQESLNALRDIVSGEPEINRCGIIFIPAWRGMTQYINADGKVIPIPKTKNGWDNKEFGTEVVLRDRELLEKAGKPQKLNAKIKNYPLFIEEVLDASGKGKLPEEIMQKVETRSRLIVKRDPSVLPAFPYTLGYDPTGNIEATPDKKGKFWITEMPKPELRGVVAPLYIAGEDPIPYGDQDLDDGSHDCMVIKNRFSQKYVAYWMDRNLDPEYTFNQKKMLQDFYFQAQNMLEMNRGEVVFQSYKTSNALHLLAKKPKHLGIKYETSRVYGWYKNRTGALANSFFISFLNNHIDKQDFLIFMRQCEVFLINNTDFLDAVIGCEILEEELRRAAEKRRNNDGGGEEEFVNMVKRKPDGTTYFEKVAVNYKNR